jgi:hypothetical protein
MSCLAGRLGDPDGDTKRERGVLYSLIRKNLADEFNRLAKPASIERLDPNQIHR